ncbi:MAG: amidase [Methylocapsa sp.]|nr:amidase [Methylocapsa sp.]
MLNLLDSASHLASALRRRQFSARHLLAAVLDAIERLNPALNAVVHLDAASAWRAAAASDERIACGEAGPFEGLPITIKDCFEVAGMPATAGAPALRDYIPAEDAPVVARLRRAGANIIGKSNVPIFAGDFQTYNKIYGTTSNPWNTSYSPGGSSGGAAAAVAAGISALEIGSDMAGSIRWPAHCCGISGLMATRGLVPPDGHIPPVSDLHLGRNLRLLGIGPLARSAADLALALDVIGAPERAGSAQALPPVSENWPKGLRVALWLHEALAPVDASVEEAVRRAALLLQDAGACVSDTARPTFSFEEAFEVTATLIHALVGAGLPEKIRQHLALTGHEFLPGDLSHRALQARGLNLTPAGLDALLTRRQSLCGKWARFFKDTDVVLCPPAPVGPVSQDHGPDLHARLIHVNGEPRPYYDLMTWACLATSAGLPAAVAPVMLGPDGLPRGVQIIAATGMDRIAIACAHLFEALGACAGAPPAAASPAIKRHMPQARNFL